MAYDCFSALFLCHLVWVDLSQTVPPRCIMYCFIRVDPPGHEHHRPVSYPDLPATLLFAGGCLGSCNAVRPTG